MLPSVTRAENPFHWVGVDTSKRKPGEHYKPRDEKSGSVALRPVEGILTLYRTWHIPPAYLIVKFLATRRYNPCLALDTLCTSWANEPRAWIQLLLLYTISYFSRLDDYKLILSRKIIKNPWQRPLSPPCLGSIGMPIAWPTSLLLWYFWLVVVK